MDVPGLPLGLAEVNTTSLKQGIHCHRFFSSHNHFDMTSAQLRSREYILVTLSTTHCNHQEMVCNLYETSESRLR